MSILSHVLKQPAYQTPDMCTDVHGSIVVRVKTGNNLNSLNLRTEKKITYS